MCPESGRRISNPLRAHSLKKLILVLSLSYPNPYMPEGDPRLELVIGLAQAEIAAQVATAVGIDGRAVGILAFDGALIGALIAAASARLALLDDSWGYPLAGLVLSTVIAFAATLGGVKAGSELSAFYERVRTFEGDGAAVEAQEIAVKDLVTTIHQNRAAVRRKEVLVGVAVVLLVLTFVLYGLYVGRLLLPAAVIVGGLLVLALLVYLVWLSFTAG